MSGPHVAERDEAAEDDVAEGGGGDFAAHRLAQPGADAIGSDDCPARLSAALGKIEPGFRRIGGDGHAAVDEDDALRLAGGGKEAAQQVGAVADAIGGSELLLEGFSEPHALQQAAGDAVLHMDFGRDDTSRRHRLPGAQRLKGPDAIGRHLEACPHFRKARRLLEQAHLDPRSGKGQACCKTGDAAAGDEIGDALMAGLMPDFARRRDAAD